YFTKEYTADKPDLKALIVDIVSEFSLNTDQERAFTLIANHAGRPQVDALRMFLGGMGGTGKSTVIRALIEFFKRRGEEHRFIILAPTGTAAALLNGFTYHSVLGMRWGGATSLDSSALRNVVDRLAGVEYIFIDEISMLNCGDLYRISAHL
ncbi:P-loop containing nucleoside triphosphate hydrolase protein, partial [Schizophyllum commune]